jgi:hypothetical protein
MTSSFFPFNAQGFVYQSGIDVLTASATTAQDALQDSQQVRSTELDIRRASDVFEDECDEQGLVICDRTALLAQEIANIAEMVNELRKAFVTAAYHHWEVSVVRWAREATPADAPLRTRDRLVAKAIEVGYPPDPELDRVRCLANLIKHDSDSARQALKGAAPALFAAIFESGTIRSPWASAIEISAATLDWTFDVVRRSGPSAQTMPCPPASGAGSAPSAT